MFDKGKVLPPSDYTPIMGKPEYIDALKDPTGGALYDWVRRALSGEENLSMWVKWLIHFIIEPDARQRFAQQGKIFALHPVDVMRLESCYGFHQDAINVKEYEYVICMREDAILDDVKDVLPQINDMHARWRNLMRNPKFRAAYIAALERALKRKKEEFGKIKRSLREQGKEDDYKTKLATHLEYCRNYESKIAKAKAPWGHKDKDREYLNFDRNARWTILHRQVPQKTYPEIGKIWAKENPWDFNNDLNNHKKNRDPRITKGQYLKHAYPKTIGGAVNGFEKKIAKVFP